MTKNKKRKGKKPNLWGNVTFEGTKGFDSYI